MSRVEAVNKDIRILFINLALRERADNFTPYGILSVMTHIRKHGYHSNHFYNMDVHRPAREEALDYIKAWAPDVLAIGCPVSTGYESCKFFSMQVKKRVPGVTVALGGNLAASAETILKKTGVDFCFIGEGEISFLEFLNAYFPAREKRNVRGVSGLAYIDDEARLVVNGYGKPFPGDSVYDVDWGILDDTSVKHYFPRIGGFKAGSVGYKYLFPDREHGIPDSLKDKTVAIALGSRGCVNRCTFCHRFTDGIRIIPAELLVSRIKELVSRFNVGAILFSDECFGANRKWLARFCELIRPMGLLWKVGGMRVSSVNPELLKLMHEAGCRSVIYGVETGSERMLHIMEKKTKLEQGVSAIQWTSENRMYTIIQLVLGMPGETVETLRETESTLRRMAASNSFFYPNNLSPNFAQALPGTPLYEYARSAGILGTSLEDEEQYLLDVSDKDAAEWTEGFTDNPQLLMEYWKTRLILAVQDSYIRKFGLRGYYKRIFGQDCGCGFWNILSSRKGSFREKFPHIFYRIRLIMWLVGIKHIMSDAGFRRAFVSVIEVIAFAMRRLFVKDDSLLGKDKSLRTILDKDMKWDYSGNEQMVELRRGALKDNTISPVRNVTSKVD